MNPCSQFLVFFSKQILGLIGSQIDIERIFSIIHILTNLEKYHLQLENLENLISMTKNWPNDVRVGVQAHSSMLELINCELDFKELDEFQNSFELEELNED
jgi:intracellular sulfur oxidation DsrE/DsrF family protein